MSSIESKLTGGDATFEDAVDYFGGKAPITASEFYKLEDEYKTLAFTISGYTKAEMLGQFFEELKAAIETGATMEEFRESTNDFLQNNGYKGLTPFQADNIYRTNTQTAFNVGHYRQMTQPSVLKARPYWQYDAVNDSRTRPSHLAMDGKVFPADSPIWDTWFPPNGFRCRCTVKSLSAQQVKERGLTVEEKVPRGVMLPDGRFANILPDPHFSVNPAKVPFTPDLSGLPEPIARAYKASQNAKAPK